MSVRSALFKLLSVMAVDHFLARRRMLRNEITVITFHRVSDEPDAIWPPMPVAVFDSLISWLSRHADVIPLEDLLQSPRHDGKPKVCISFDDGYIDFIENALPILRRHGLPSHHNICPGLIDAGELPWTQQLGLYLQQHAGRRLVLPDDTEWHIPARVSEHDYLRLLQRLYVISGDERRRWLAGLAGEIDYRRAPRLMNWDEILICQEQGVRFGSHSCWHGHLPTLDNTESLREEIAGSRSRLADALGHAPSYFAFPNGFHDERSLAMVKQSGYLFALICGETACPAAGIQSGRPVIVPRITMGARDQHEERLRVLGLHECLRAWRRMLVDR